MIQIEGMKPLDLVEGCVQYVRGPSRSSILLKKMLTSTTGILVSMTL
jgi:hypothetical protein